MKKLVVFDLDGTLAESKQPIPGAVSFWLRRLSNYTKIAIISGCSWNQMRLQCMGQLKVTLRQKANFVFLPMSGSSFYIWKDDAWLYKEELTLTEKYNIYRVWEKMMDIVELYPPEKTYGEVAEDRGSQITFSMCGQQAPLEVKEAWQLENEEKRQQLAQYMSLMNLEHQGFSVKCGGTTSIDVTRAGRDKAYGIEQLQSYFKIDLDDIIFMGDRLEEGGNDRPVLDMGVESVWVKDYNDTILKIQEMIDDHEEQIRRHNSNGERGFRSSSQGSPGDDPESQRVWAGSSSS